MSDPLLLLALVLPPLLLGAALLPLLGIAPRDDRLGWWAWAAVLGALGTGALAFVWSWTGVALTPAVALALPLGTAGLLALLTRTARARLRVAAAARAATAPLSVAPGWDRALFALLLGGCLVWALAWMTGATQFPLMDGDEAAVWSTRPKLLHVADGFTDEYFAFMDAAPRWPVNKDYPLLVPMLETWSFGVAGGIVHTPNRWPVQVLHLALLVALAAALRRRVRPWVAGVCVLLFFGTIQSGEQYFEAKPDSLVALGLLLALDGWARWRAAQADGGGGGSGAVDDGQRWWRLAAVGLALSASSKHEGLIQFVAFGGALLVTGEFWPRFFRDRATLLARLAWALLPVLVLAGGWAFNRHFGYESNVARGGWDAEGPGFLERLVRQAPGSLPSIAAFHIDEVFLEPRQNHFVFLLLAALLVLGGREARRAPRLVAPLTVAFVFSAFVTVYLASPFEDPEGRGGGAAWYLATAGVRVCWQLLPAALLGLALVVAAVLPGTVLAPPARADELGD